MRTIEKIWWWDPAGFAQWFDGESVKQLEPARCVTIAEVIHETDHWIVTSASYSNIEGSETEYADITVIPRGCIERRQTVDITMTDHEEADFGEDTGVNNKETKQ